MLFKYSMCHLYDSIFNNLCLELECDVQLNETQSIGGYCVGYYVGHSLSSRTPQHLVGRCGVLVYGTTTPLPLVVSWLLR
jgi:hypothetical protein